MLSVWLNDVWYTLIFFIIIIEHIVILLRKLMKNNFLPPLIQKLSSYLACKH